MIDSNLRTKTRTQLFFGQWRYYAVFYLPEAHVLRKLDHDHINYRIDVRRGWAARAVNFGGSWYRSVVPITDSVVSNLHGVCDFLLGDNEPKKLVISSNHIYIYANDRSLFERLERTGLARREETVRAELAGTPGTIVLKNPTYKLRSYFRECKVEQNINVALRQFLGNQDNIRICPSLQHWLSFDYHLLSSHFFIDHDDTGTILMLNMIAPGVIRKTQPIEAAK